MEFGEAITMVNTISQGIKAAKEACDEIPIGLFKPTKERVLELQSKIEYLEDNIRLGFPMLKKLVILYSDIKSDVSIARALSDKVSEILRLSEDINRFSDFTTTFISTTRTEYTRVKSKLQELPALDTAQAGMIAEKINRVGVLIRDLQIISNQNSKLEGTNMENKRGEISKLFQDISGEYSEIESKLSELLNKEILRGFDI